MTATDVEEFNDNDEDYIAWCEAHPDGYVLNLNDNPDEGDATLHRAHCPTITGTPAHGTNWDLELPQGLAPRK